LSTSAIAGLATLSSDKTWLAHRARYLDVTFLLEVGDTPYLVRIRGGRVEAVDQGPFVLPRWTFALRASREAWETLWKPVPPPGGHDLMAMIKSGALKLEGDHYPFFANLLYFKELLALPRSKGGMR
jgi:hypothetical protein